MMTIAYQIGDNLYLNLTNRCSNDCEFCVRRDKSGLEGHELWLEREPEYAEIIEAIGDPTRYNEVVFVGFGEPLSRIDMVKQVAKWLKEQGVFIRINTNGQANLINGFDVLPELAGLVDAISISLNATSAEEYDKLCHSVYGEEAYGALLEFTREAKNYIPKVTLSIVNYGGVVLEKAQKIADQIGVDLRVREYIE